MLEFCALNFGERAVEDVAGIRKTNRLTGVDESFQDHHENFVRSVTRKDPVWRDMKEGSDGFPEFCREGIGIEIQTGRCGLLDGFDH